MASEHRIVKINDKNLKRSRLKKYRRVYKGDVIRVSRATTIPPNEVIQKLGLPSNTAVSVNSSELIVAELNQGTGVILSPLSSGSVSLPDSGVSYTGFATTWNTENAGTSANDQITLPIQNGGVYSFDVYYNGAIIKTVTTYTDNIVTFPDGAGVKTIEIVGTIKRLKLSTDTLKLIEVHNWGSLELDGGSTSAFDGCSNMDISATDELNTVGMSSFSAFFRNCTSLTRLPFINSSVKTNCSQIVLGCTSLTEIPLWDYSTVTGTGFLSAFAGCTGLTSFPLIDTSGATNLASTWNGCIGLTSFPLIDTSSCLSFANTWRTCTGLTSFPLLDFSLATTLTFTFEGCTGLTAFLTLNLASMTNGNGFLQGTTIDSTSYNALLVATEANNQNGAHQWSMGSAKYYGAGTTARAALIVDHGWTIVDGGLDEAFVTTWDTEQLGGTSSATKTVVIPTQTGTFDATTTVNWGDGNIDTNMSTYNDPRWTHVYASTGIYTVEITGTFSAFAFYNAGDKTKLVGVHNWGTFAPTLYGAFEGCVNMEMYAGNDLDLSGITSPTGMLRWFKNCSSMTNLPLFDTSTIKSLSATFSGCSSLTTLPLFDTSSVTNMSEFLFGCSSLLTIPDFDCSGITSVNGMTNMFFGCTSLTTISLSSLGTATSLQGTFFDCSSLVTVILPDTSNIVNFFVAFANCTALKTVSVLDFSSAINVGSMFQGVTLNTSVWSDLLISAEATNAETDLTFVGGSSKYNVAGGVARTALINRLPTGWTITDGGAE